MVVIKYVRQSFIVATFAAVRNEIPKSRKCIGSVSENKVAPNTAYTYMTTRSKITTHPIPLIPAAIPDRITENDRNE